MNNGITQLYNTPGAEAIYPYTVPEAIIVDVDKNLTEMLNKNIYLIDLQKFGITEGFINHTSPYNELEWKLALDNTNGIENALQYAADNGYTMVYLPKGNYNVCYRTTTDAYRVHLDAIKIPSNIIFDLNQSSLKVIFDSHNYNPLVPIPSNSTNLAKSHPYAVGGMVFNFKGSRYSTIRNGELIGDIYERSFDDTETGWNRELGMEQTYGLYFGESAYRCSAENMSIHGFMGDSLCGGLLPKAEYGTLTGGYSPKFYPGYIHTDGTDKTDINGAYTTNYIGMENLNHDIITMITGIGYNRYPGFANENLIITWYTKDKTFISQENFRYLDSIKVPYNALYLRISCFLETPTETDITNGYITKGFQLVAEVTRFVTIKNCDIYDNHRGGISNVCNDFVIEGCHIFNNGLGAKEGFPQFPDSTRYCINFEDVVANSAIIRNNLIEDSFNGLLLSGRDILVEGNTLKNNMGIELYHNSNVRIANNTIYNGTIGCVTRSASKKRIITITNNTIFNSHIFNGSDYETDFLTITNNICTGKNAGIKLRNNGENQKNHVISNNVINITEDPKLGYQEADLFTGDNNKFIINSSKAFYFYNPLYKGSRSNIIFIPDYNENITDYKTRTSINKIRNINTNSSVEFLYRRSATEDKYIFAKDIDIIMDNPYYTDSFIYACYDRSITDADTKAIMHFNIENTNIYTYMKNASGSLFFNYKSWNNTKNNDFIFTAKKCTVENDVNCLSDNLFKLSAPGKDVINDSYIYNLENCIFINNKETPIKLINNTDGLNLYGNITFNIKNCTFIGNWDKTMPNEHCILNEYSSTLN